jgi:hypothetical protein
VIEADKLKSWADISASFSTAFNFPRYYGKNWAAFDECMRDLRWLKKDYKVQKLHSICVVLDGADFVLTSANKSFSMLLQALEDYSRDWAVKPENDEWWDDRPLVFFTVIRLRAKCHETSGFRRLLPKRP